MTYETYVEALEKLGDPVDKLKFMIANPLRKFRKQAPGESRGQSNFSHRADLAVCSGYDLGRQSTGMRLKGMAILENPDPVVEACDY